MPERDASCGYRYIEGDDLVADVARYLELDGTGDRAAWDALDELRDAYPSTAVRGQPDATSSPEGYKVRLSSRNGTDAITVGLPRSPAPAPVEIGDEELPEGYTPRTDE
ncbi:MAG: hypothetical protein SVW77_00975 [Candidatus Nanohaloarchaea archaeon]|nr:hypothetical protein [Candidatus Nanohaloarchaea archaeon]